MPLATDVATVHVRPIRQEDLARVLQAEQAWNSYEDDVFGMPQTYPWCHTEDDLLAIIRTRADENGHGSTRVFVLEMGGQVVGGFGYALQADHYEMIFVSLDPNGPLPKLVEAIATHLRGKLHQGKRKRALVWLRDRDEAGLRILYPLWQKSSFSARLVLGRFGHDDGWQFTLRSEQKNTC